MEPLLTLDDVAGLLRITPRSVSRLCRQRKLAFVEVDARGTRRFVREDVEAFIRSRRLEPPKKLDTFAPAQLPFHPKPATERGEKGDGKSSRAELRKEFRQWLS
jgi:excisionase family DNA binding protein